jgi:hypothetical protein
MSILLKQGHFNEELLANTFAMIDYVKKHPNRDKTVKYYYKPMMDYIQNNFMDKISKYLLQDDFSYRLPIENNLVKPQGREIIEQIKQLLNLTPNFYDNYDSLTDMINRFNDILKSKTSESFQNSINKSLYNFKKPWRYLESINTLENNTAGSFVLTFYILKHLMSNNLKSYPYQLLLKSCT